jgi:hypothetical protein
MIFIVWPLAGVIAFLLIFGFRGLKTKHGRSVATSFAALGFLGLIAVITLIDPPDSTRRKIRGV